MSVVVETIGVSGLMALSAESGSAPPGPASNWMSRVDSLLSLLNRRCASVGSRSTYDTRLLTERAVLSNLPRAGRESCNRSCRLIETRDGWIALNLPRESDWQTLPALLGRHVEQGSWSVVTAAARDFGSDELVATGRLLGLPIAVASAPDGVMLDAQALRDAPEFIGSKEPPHHGVLDWQRLPPLVVDLSALWAGPLCGQILAACGARVIKVESIRRPDSIRHTSPAFFDLLNVGKESVVLDFASAPELDRLRALISRADLVITSARPRAFEQMNLVPEALMEANPRLSWVAITAYGWRGENRNAVGFGDDVAAAAGLISWCGDGPTFVGDAIADPLTGIAAAVAATDALRASAGRGPGGSAAQDASAVPGAGGSADVEHHAVGGRGADVGCGAGAGRREGHTTGTFVDASLYASARFVATAIVTPRASAGAEYIADQIEASAPQARAPVGAANAFGADTARVLRELT